MFMQILELILSSLGESFLSKVVEQTTDNALNNANNINDFELILKALQKSLKSLSAKASDVEEEIKNAELSGRKKRKREVEEWLEQVKSFEKEVDELGSRVELEGFIMRLMDGGMAAKLNERVEKLVEQSRNFGELVLDVCGIRGEILLTNGMVGEAFNENLERILKLLETRQVSSIGVYGMGGVGKTTLAKHIHNRLLQQYEGHVFWVTVSQEFTVTRLQDKIARFLGVDLSNEDNEDIRAARLHRVLSQMKNSVLILDDVWENIDLLRVGYPVECCRLIITTRSSEVCHQIRCQKVIPVEKLHEDEAWKLFTETLANEIELGPQVEGIARSMAKLCDGLPLGIITVAGSMRGKTLGYMWRNALVKLKEYVVGQDGMGEVEVFKVLKYSFDRLNMNHQSHEFNSFQLCFMYCSLYPEDYKIPEDILVRNFILDGLVDERKSRRAQVDQGHSILHTLVSACLLESCVDENGYECVKMHDLVRGMALKIGEGKYMVRAGDKSLMEIPNEQEWTKGLEKVSLMENGIRRIGDEISPNCPNLSTLLLLENPLGVIPNSFFSKMQGLCTLHLCKTHIRMLPDSICDMKNLKALLLGNCHNLENVPYLGKLEALRELNLSNTAIKEVPQGVEELLDLEFLSINAPKLEIIRSGLLLKLSHLQHVNLPFHIQAPIEETENLKQLEVFCGGVRNVNEFNCFVGSRVHGTCWYIIGIGSPSAASYVLGKRDFGCCNNELILSECNLDDEKVLGRSIVYLTVRECEGLSICFVDNFSRSSNPTSLKRLVIERCVGVECILRSEQGIGLASQISNTLERIELVELEDLNGLIQKEEIRIGGAASAALAQPVFSYLKQLIFRKCNKMKHLGLPVLGVPNLEYIEIRECGEIEEIFEDEGRDSVILPKLQELDLLLLPKLKSVCKATMICNSIIGIFIVNCPRLKKLPVHLDDPPPPTLGLGAIKVDREWWESLEWEKFSASTISCCKFIYKKETQELCLLALSNLHNADFLVKKLGDISCSTII